MSETVNVLENVLECLMEVEACFKMNKYNCFSIDLDIRRPGCTQTTWIILGWLLSFFSHWILTIRQRIFLGYLSVPCWGSFKLSLLVKLLYLAKANVRPSGSLLRPPSEYFCPGDSQSNMNNAQSTKQANKTRKQLTGVGSWKSCLFAPWPI